MWYDSRVSQSIAGAICSNNNKIVCKMRNEIIVWPIAFSVFRRMPIKLSLATCDSFSLNKRIGIFGIFFPLISCFYFSSSLGACLSPIANPNWKKNYLLMLYISTYSIKTVEIVLDAVFVFRFTFAWNFVTNVISVLFSWYFLLSTLCVCVWRVVFELWLCQLFYDLLLFILCVVCSVIE